MLNLKEKRQLVLFILIALTLIFIFVQSALPISVSNKESEAVGDAVGDVVAGIGSGADDKKANLLDFIRKNVRKMAHFSEYALLGAEVFLLLMFAYGEKGKVRMRLPFGVKRLLSSALFALLVAFIDESVQILSKRGYSVLDMWIDISGYATSSVVLYIIFTFIGKKRLKP